MHRKSIGALFLAAILLTFMVGLHYEPASGFPEKSGSSRFFSPPSLTHQVLQYVDWKYVDPGRAQPMRLLKGSFRNLETQYPEVVIELLEESGEVTVRIDERKEKFTFRPNPDFQEAATLLEKVLA